MTPVVAGTAIGAAALTVGRGALGAVSNSLSFAAQLVGAASGNSPSQADAKSKQASADQAALKLRTDEMRQRISRQLAAAGIQLCEPVEMVTSGTGGIAVAGPHPQQAAIEEVLSSDVLLERDFNQLASDYSDLAEQGRGGDLPPTLTIAVAQTSPLAR
jgi:hypothetical protein